MSHSPREDIASLNGADKETIIICYSERGGPVKKILWADFRNTDFFANFAIEKSDKIDVRQIKSLMLSLDFRSTEHKMKHFSYKSLISSRELRLRILGCLNWIPDKWMVPLQYYIHVGRKLNLKNPKRFTEKLQLYKLKYRNPYMLRCTDKYEARKVVEEKGFSNILIPLLGVYDSPKDIDFNGLPDEFVAKITDGSGGHQVLICRDKAALNRDDFFKQLSNWMSLPRGKSPGREWAYENGYPRRIVIEQLIKTEGRNDLQDYKFYCFGGKPYYCQLIDNRSTTETIDFYDMNWAHQDFVGLNPACRNSEKRTPKPDNLDELIQIATTLSSGFPFVRVDLYDVNGKVYFGELTFYPASGLGRFTPDEWDERMGSLLDCDLF